MTTEKQLIEKLKEYNSFLGEEIDSNATYLYVHGISCSQERYEKGAKLRSEISVLEQQLKEYTTPIKKQECLKAIQCLYLVVPEEVANDIKKKVVEALEEAEQLKEIQEPVTFADAEKVLDKYILQAKKEGFTVEIKGEYWVLKAMQEYRNL